MEKDKLQCIVGKNIRQLRKSRNMTAYELSELMNLTPGCIGLMERGKRGTTMHNLFTIAKIFNITVDDLFKEEYKGREGKIISLRGKLSSMTYGLDVCELKFFLDMIESFRILRKKAKNP